MRHQNYQTDQRRRLKGKQKRLPDIHAYIGIEAIHVHVIHV
jgi:hypothetical protein